jgi:hypothetical protein
MSAPFGPFILTLDDITKRMRSTFEGFTDPRKGKNTTYTMVDAALSAFAVFFLQSPSFLEYPRSLEQTRTGGGNNARTLFGAHEIPSDNPIRTLLDATDPTAVEPIFSYFFHCVGASRRRGSPTARWAARCCSPATGRHGVLLLTGQAMARTIQPGGTPTAR